jgi:rhodanese-related sulfurtransferase
MREVRRLILMLGAGLSVALVAACDTKTSDKEIRILSVGEAKALWDRAQKGQASPLFIDPRPAKYYNAAHIPGARHLELPGAPLDHPRDPALEEHQILVVYGDHPGDVVAKSMTKRLLALNYSVVRWFAGGMKDWTARGYPVDPLGPPAPTGVPPVPTGEPAATGAPSANPAKQ